MGRVKQSGVVAIYARKNLNTSVNVSTSVPGQFELLAINVKLGHHECPLVIVGVYRPDALNSSSQLL